jgi:hypothetical protein
MAKFTLLGVATVLSIALVTPILAQPVVQERGSYAFYHPSGDMEPAPFGHGTTNATPLAPSFRPSVVGEETTTRPWSAPVGHRQPRTAEVPTSTSVSPYVLDQEDANVDRKIRGVCRGC